MLSVLSAGAPVMASHTELPDSSPLRFLLSMEGEPATFSSLSQVAIEGDVIAVADRYSGCCQATGQVILFARASTGDWTETATLRAGESRVHFGASTAIVDGVLFVGEIPMDPESHRQFNGVVRVYAEIAGEWTEITTLGPSGIPANAAMNVCGRDFGWTMAVAGSRLFVGAPDYGGACSADTGGTVWVYDISIPMAPSLLGIIENPLQDGTSFGYRIMASGDSVVVTAGYGNGFPQTTHWFRSTSTIDPTISSRLWYAYLGGTTDGAAIVADVDERFWSWTYDCLDVPADLKCYGTGDRSTAPLNPSGWSPANIASQTMVGTNDGRSFIIGGYQVCGGCPYNDAEIYEVVQDSSQTVDFVDHGFELGHVPYYMIGPLYASNDWLVAGALHEGEAGVVVAAI